MTTSVMSPTTSNEPANCLRYKPALPGHLCKAIVSSDGPDADNLSDTRAVKIKLQIRTEFRNSRSILKTYFGENSL